MDIQSLQQWLDRAAARQRTAAQAATVLTTLAIALLAMVLAGLADRALALSRNQRWAVWLAIVLPAIAFAVVRMVRSRKQFDRQRAALQIEAAVPTLEQRLVTLASQWQMPPAQRGSAGMLRQLTSEVAAILAQPRRAKTPPALRRAIIRCGVVLLLGVGLAMIPPLGWQRSAARIAQPWATLAPATFTQLSALPGSTIIPAGRSLRIVATATNLGPAPVVLHVERPDGWIEQRLLPAENSTFAGEIVVERDTRYYLTAGDATTDTFTVTAQPLPGLASLSARVRYPAALHWPDATIADAERIDVPAGSEIMLTLTATLPLADATLQVSGNAVATTPGRDASTRVAKWSVKRDQTATITLRGTDGVTQTVARPLQIKAMQDRPAVATKVDPATRLRVPTAFDPPGYEQPLRHYFDAIGKEPK